MVGRHLVAEQRQNARAGKVPGNQGRRQRAGAKQQLDELKSKSA